MNLPKDLLCVVQQYLSSTDLGFECLELVLHQYDPYALQFASKNCANLLRQCKLPEENKECLPSLLCLSIYTQCPVSFGTLARAYRRRGHVPTMEFKLAARLGRQDHFRHLCNQFRDLCSERSANNDFLVDALELAVVHKKHQIVYAFPLMKGIRFLRMLSILMRVDSFRVFQKLVQIDTSAPATLVRSYLARNINCKINAQILQAYEFHSSDVFVMKGIGNAIKDGQVDFVKMYLSNCTFDAICTHRLEYFTKTYNRPSFLQLIKEHRP